MPRRSAYHVENSFMLPGYVRELVSFGSVPFRYRCRNIICSVCLETRPGDMYVNCPNCGTEIEPSARISAVCQCGTWMMICRGAVMVYIIPSRLAIEELSKNNGDII